ncbi:hypothetical protein GTY74_32820 [Streptomyces sp. SID8350]|uniref:Uncharacterized protein n=1 Tax=Streptomyces rhizosphaericola TaxID=2564098 RepID=A0ABY2PBH1_9ACTN|nr:hypothetical protein [Streptomyces sp. SID8356]MYT95510.1 hypothetical protein [Streptomyces sp. SID8359]MYU01929.1 hypothetical protein [Streptomyces sp. SID8350]NGO85324.1 hypothetical protein [Streptomyces sp. 196(2019)]RST22432.1 hypothetical protein EF908_16545 [Streptomyces sp. WAC04770]TGZ07449.1 hypothetical protein E5Z02_20805 [Streptomyces rhizosphaericola]
MRDVLPHCRIVYGSIGPNTPRRTGVAPVQGRYGAVVPLGSRLRALTLSGCPRMLQVALRACAPQT